MTDSKVEYTIRRKPYADRPMTVTICSTGQPALRIDQALAYLEMAWRALDEELSIEGNPDIREAAGLAKQAAVKLGA